MKRWETFSEEQQKEILLNSKSYADAARKFGYKNCDTVLKKDIQKLISDFNLPFYPDRNENLIGKQFGKLTVISQAESKRGVRFWKCKCECGNDAIVETAHLKSGHTQSCGCYWREKIFESNAKDISGQKFGKLTVLKQSDVKKNRCIYWDCLCECGNHITVCGASLRNQNTLSCGCLEESKGEMIIEQLLRELDIKFKKQFSFSDLKGDNSLLRFDFAILDNNKNIQYLIEFQGIQHFKPIEYFGGEKRFNKQKEYDEKKKKYCQSNEIPLIEITYNQLKNLDKTKFLEILKEVKIND